ncbi:MAG: prepilin-type N-terminal cleavage/methylation domain-containing protein [Phycisphaeraceae bacterium]|nr:prepilin-type N-terminal cleavage/methylation domain-containing protein [Phycisphaeraceae bacterium]
MQRQAVDRSDSPRSGPAAAPRCAVAGPVGFSLIELLVAIAIISLLIGILLPALGGARKQALTTQCLATVRQIATAALTYETDMGRLPAHVAESGTSNLAHAVRSPGLDARPLYEPYMNVDFFRCAYLPAWSPSTATAASVHANYVLTAGYFADHDGGVWANQRWIHSDQPWRFDGRPITVLAMDRSYRVSSASPGVNMHIINHGGADFRLQNVDTPMHRGVARLREDIVDLRRVRSFNAAMTDGSALAVGGSDDNVIEVPDRDPTRDGTYLVPTR